LADNLVIEAILIAPHGKSHGFSFFVTKQRHNPNRLDPLSNQGLRVGLIYIKKDGAKYPEPYKENPYICKLLKYIAIFDGVH
jgi:hypothetical protein